MIEYSVDELVGEMAEAVDRHLDEVVTVRGELTRWSVAASGHGYGELRGQRAFIHLVALKWECDPGVRALSPGSEVMLTGRPGVYGTRAQLQFRVREAVVSPGGGPRETERDQVLARLARDGLLCGSRKRPIPEMPSRIGLVTSLNGSALEDVIRVLESRSPWSSLVHAHAPVQGAAAPGRIVAALQALTRDPSIEVLLVTRGGGDRSALEAFDCELVARAVARSPVPVVSAVGHADDLSVTDLLADASAITPTAAAHMVAPGVERVREALDRTAEGLGAVGARVQVQIGRLDSLRQSNERTLCIKLDRGRLVRDRFGPDRLDAALLQGLRLRQGGVDFIGTTMSGALRARLEIAYGARNRSSADRLHGHLRAALSRETRGCRGVRGRIDSLSPLRILARGYSVACGPSGRAVRSPQDVNAGDSLLLWVRDGFVPVTVSRNGGAT